MSNRYQTGMPSAQPSGQSSKPTCNTLPENPHVKPHLTLHSHRGWGTSAVWGSCCAGCCCRCGCRLASAAEAMIRLHRPGTTNLLRPLLSCWHHAERSTIWHPRSRQHPGCAAALQYGATWLQTSATLQVKNGQVNISQNAYLITRAACCSLCRLNRPKGCIERAIGRLLYQPAVLLAGSSGLHC